jgi:hypothetical protein
MSQNFGTQMGNRTSKMLLFMGILWIVIAAALYFGLSGIPYAGGTMMFLAVLFGLIGVGMIVASFMLGRSVAGSAREMASATLGSAQILSVTQTGMTLNDQPRIKFDLLVTLPGQAPYQAEHAEFVPLILLMRCQPGAVVAVRVNPAKPDKVTISWNEAPPSATAAMNAATAALAGAGYGAAAGAVQGAVANAGTPAGAESLAQVAAAMQASGAPAAPVFAQADQANYSVEQLRQWLRENGIPATARIDMLQDAGQTLGTDRMMVMQVTLEAPGRPPFQGPPSAAMVPVDKVGRLAVGVTLPVLVAPDNPNMTMFEWDKI